MMDAVVKDFVAQTRVLGSSVTDPMVSSERAGILTDNDKLILWCLLRGQES